jgi:hypothetical protein
MLEIKLGGIDASLAVELSKVEGPVSADLLERDDLAPMLP